MIRLAEYLARSSRSPWLVLTGAFIAGGVLGLLAVLGVAW